MFRTKRNGEENEEDMASRLQIEMGKSPCMIWVLFPSPTGIPDREKGTSSKRAQNLVDVFRGVSFDDWLQLTMEVTMFFWSSGSMG